MNFPSLPSSESPSLWTTGLSHLLARGFVFLAAFLTLGLGTPSLAATGTNSGSAGGNTPVDTTNPDLALNWVICVSGGLFPDRTFDPLAGADDTPFLGEIRCIAFNPNPASSFNTRFLPCDGRPMPVNQNFALFSLLGTNFGGDGISTFNLPDLRGRVPVGLSAQLPIGTLGGQENVTLTSSQLPSHTHTISGGTTLATGSGQAFTNQQPFLALNICTQGSGVFQSVGWIRVFAFIFTPPGFYPGSGGMEQPGINDLLFAQIGTTFGGDGVSTFGLPDLRGRSLLGSGAGPSLSSRALGESSGSSSLALSGAQMPSHTHTVTGGNTGSTGGGSAIDKRQPFVAFKPMIAKVGLFENIDSEPGIGEIRFFANGFIPNGFLTCDGTQLPVSQNQAFFALVGTLFGGNGTAFNLPDLRGRSPAGTGQGPSTSSRVLGTKWGAESVTLTAAQLPAHVHALPAVAVPSVTSPTSASVTHNAATLGGNVTSDGGATISARGVVFALTSQNANPQIGGLNVTNVTGTGTTGVFTVNVTGLAASSGYSFAAYATNTSGTTYTTPVSTFTTTAPPDTTPPTLTSVSLASNNTATSRAKAGNTITATFTASEPITTPTVTLAGKTAIVSNTSGNTWTGTITVASNDTQGAASLGITFSDLAGNPGTAVTATTNASGVVIDTVPPAPPAAPTLDQASDTGVSSSDGRTSDNTPTFTGTTEAFASVRLTLTGPGGETFTGVVTAGADGTWSFTASTLPSGTNSANVSVTDLAGNSSVSPSSLLIIDTTAPALASAITISDTALKIGDSATVTFAFTERVTGFTTADITRPSASLTGLSTSDGGTTWTATLRPTAAVTAASNLLVLDLTALTDIAGNPGVGSANSGNYAVDTVLPTLTSVSIASSNANTALARVGDTITVSFTSSETITSPAVTIAGKAASVSNPAANNWKGTVTVASGDTNGPVTFGLTCFDLSGNAGTTVSATTDTSGVTIDTRSANADLSALAISPGSLSPGFSSGLTSYSVTFPNTTLAATLTPTKADPTATVTVNGHPPATPVSLAVGGNTVTVLVTAEDTVTTKTYTVTVTRESVYETWAAGNGASSNASDDTDHDGVSNLLEFAFGTSPTSGASGPGTLQFSGTFSSLTVTSLGQPVSALENTPAGADLRVLYSRRKDAAAAGLTYTTEFSNDLTTWEAISPTPTILADDGTYEVLSLTYPRFLSNGKKARFFRVRVTSI